MTGSLPVLFFGDVLTAKAASVGLNPSKQEYLDPSGQELTGDKRRFETLGSLGCHDRSSLDEERCERAIAAMRAYFQRGKPVYGWFRRLHRREARPSVFRLSLRGRRMGHDPLFKAILEAFLKDFLELFFPEVAERLDFKTLRPLDKEARVALEHAANQHGLSDHACKSDRSCTRLVACPQISLVGTARSPQIPSDPGFRRLLGSRTHCRGSGTVMGGA